MSYIFYSPLRSILFVFACLMSITLSAQNGKKNEKAVIKTALYCEHCLECESCGKKFNKELYKIKGMRQFEVNQEENTITVFYNGKKTDLNTIRTYISKLGFDADDVKADPVAYEQLDDCCKK